MSLLQELQRRNVVRVVLAYQVGGFLVVEGMDIFTETFTAPAWIMKFAIGGFVVGLVPVTILAWMYEITPGGMVRHHDAALGPRPGSQRRLDIVIIIMLAVAISLLLDRASDKNSPGIVERLPAAAKVGAPPMVAVLPFIATSLDGDSSFFATGMHDDLLTQLAQLHSLRVISRTSVMEYKDTTRNIREIGAALGADAILEGRVQSAGGQIRINAELIDARTDEHLWAETYDRELSASSIFDLQTELATAISIALKAALTPQEADQLGLLPTQNLAAYRSYHHAMEIRDAPGPYEVDGFLQALEEAVQLDPGFTRAQAELVGALSFMIFDKSDPELIARAEAALKQVQRLAPGSADSLIAQAYYTYYVLKNYPHAYQIIVQAQAKAPSDVRLLELKSWIQRRNGDLEGKIETLKLNRALDPLNSRWRDSIVHDLSLLHRYDEVRRELAGWTGSSYLFDLTAHYLRQEQQPDVERLVEEVYQLHQEYPLANLRNLWEAYIMNRDFEAAAQLLRERMEGTWIAGSLGAWQTRDRLELITAHLGRDPQLLEAALARLVAGTADQPEDIDAALLAILEGNSQEAVILIRRGSRAIQQDYAEYVNVYAEICRMYAMAGSVTESVECLEEGVTNPSNIVPFIEPSLPHYDAIRESAEFQSLIRDMQNRTKR